MNTCNNPTKESDVTKEKTGGGWVRRLVRLLFGHDEYCEGEHIAHEPAIWQSASARRKLRITAAHVRLQWYLLTQGMWRGECAFTGYHVGSKRVGYLAATTGSIFDGTVTPKRVFWDEISPTNAQSPPTGGKGA